MKDIELRSEIARMLVELRRMRREFPHINIYVPKREYYDQPVLSDNRQDYVVTRWYDDRIDIVELIDTLKDWRQRYGNTRVYITTEYDDDSYVYMSLTKEAVESDISYHKTVREVYKSAEYYDRSIRNQRIRELEAELRLLKESSDE